MYSVVYTTHAGHYMVLVNSARFVSPRPPGKIYMHVLYRCCADYQNPAVRDDLRLLSLFCVTQKGLIYRPRALLADQGRSHFGGCWFLWFTVNTLCVRVRTIRILKDMFFLSCYFPKRLPENHRLKFVSSSRRPNSLRNNVFRNCHFDPAPSKPKCVYDSSSLRP